jgi:prepilin-type N-terminal cleavage/methylation domain-containing protein
MSPKHPSGFTLIELIVVISLISIILFFSLPRFHNAFLADPVDKASLWIMMTVSALKDKAFREQKQYQLHVDMGDNRLWITDESMTEAEREDAMLKAYRLPEEVRLSGVEFPDRGNVSMDRAGIYFYRRGYSDQAFIHMDANGGEKVSLGIEPFLSRVELYNEYKGFGN